MISVLDQACEILTCSDPSQKAKLALKMQANWEANNKDQIQKTLSSPPATPGRPKAPLLVPPKDVPRRRLGSKEGRGALLHAIAHIELNAIDLAADMMARFAQHNLIIQGGDALQSQSRFISNWVKVCAEEAKHFNLLTARLEALGFSYGDFPAHNGLWDAAESTKTNIAARLAIAPMVLEARGLDVTPGMIKKLTVIGDMESANILKVIYEEEVEHVKIGASWFQRIAKQMQKEPVGLFHLLVEKHFKGRLKPPFNVQARTLAGLTEEYYLPLSNC